VDLDLVGQHLGGDTTAWWIMSERFRSAEPIKPGRRTASDTRWVQSYGYLAYRMVHVRPLHTDEFLGTFATPCSHDFYSHSCFSVDAGSFRVVWFSAAIKNTFIGELSYRTLRVTTARDAGFVRTIAARRVSEWVRSLLPFLYC
jgi:hypothetical protein